MHLSRTGKFHIPSFTFGYFHGPPTRGWMNPPALGACVQWPSGCALSSGCRRLSGGSQIGAGYRGGRLSPGRPQPGYLMFTQVTSGSGMHPRCYAQQQTCPSSMVSAQTRSV